MICLDNKFITMLTFCLDVKKIPVVNKLQIVCAVLSYPHQNPSKYNLCCKIQDTIDRVCCFPLYYDKKGMFFLLCFLFPIVIVVYCICIVVFVAYFVGTLFTLLFSYLCNREDDLSCIFTWPCRLCKNEHDCSEYIVC